MHTACAQIQPPTLSPHVPCSDGVLEGNYVEQKAGKELHSTGRNVFNYGSQRRMQSTHREDYNEYVSGYLCAL